MGYVSVVDLRKEHEKRFKEPSDSLSVFSLSLAVVCLNRDHQ